MSAHGSARALAKALPGLRVDAARMRANLDSVRAGVAPETAQAWFAPELAEQAAQLARARLQALRQTQHP